MKFEGQSSFRGLVVVLGALAGGMFVPRAVGQTLPAFSITSPSSAFQPWMTPSGVQQLEPFNDQQTGQPKADFLGVLAGATGLTPSSGTTIPNIPAAMVTAGSVGGADSIIFRFRFVDKSTQNYLGSNLSVGLSLPGAGTASGSATIYLTVEPTNKGPQFFFQSPGNLANVSPSTTSLDGGAFAGNPYSRSAPLVMTAANYDYREVTTLPTPETNYDRSATNGTDVNAFATFAVSFASIQQATRALTGNTSFVFDSSTEMAFLAFTATQYNSINQDIQGTATQASNTLTTTWSTMGAFTDFVTADGYKKPVPEATTVAQVGALLVAGLVGGYYRRRKSGAAACAARE